MSFEIIPTTLFAKELKALSKKYPKMIRMQITGKLAGKSGGARVITFVKIVNEKVYLLSIYDKADQANNAALDALLKSL